MKPATNAKVTVRIMVPSTVIDHSAILQNSLDRALFFYTFICEVRLSGVSDSTHLRIFENSIKIAFDSPINLLAITILAI